MREAVCVLCREFFTSRGSSPLGVCPTCLRDPDPRFKPLSAEEQAEVAEYNRLKALGKYPDGTDRKGGGE